MSCRVSQVASIGLGIPIDIHVDSEPCSALGHKMELKENKMSPIEVPTGISLFVA